MRQVAFRKRKDTLATLPTSSSRTALPRSHPESPHVAVGRRCPPREREFWSPNVLVEEKSKPAQHHERADLGQSDAGKECTDHAIRSFDANVHCWLQCATWRLPRLASSYRPRSGDARRHEVAFCRCPQVKRAIRCASKNYSRSPHGRIPRRRFGCLPQAHCCYPPQAFIRSLSRFNFLKLRQHVK